MDRPEAAPGRPCRAGDDPRKVSSSLMSPRCCAIVSPPTRSWPRKNACPSGAQYTTLPLARAAGGCKPTPVPGNRDGSSDDDHAARAREAVAPALRRRDRPLAVAAAEEEELKAQAGDKFFEMMVEMSPQQVVGQLTK